MPPDAVRVSPTDHLHLACRCGEPVSLPRFAEAYTTCRCARRYSFDTELLVIRAPNGEQEGGNYRGTPIRFDQMPSSNVRRMFFDGMKVAPTAADAWLLALRRLGEGDAYESTTLGGLSSACECRGHLLRVYRVEGLTVHLDHSDLVSIEDGTFDLTDATVLAEIDLWVRDIHGDGA